MMKTDDNYDDEKKKIIKNIRITMKEDMMYEDV